MPDQANIATLPMNQVGAAVPARRFVRLHPDDNVVVATVSLPTGTVLESEGVTVAARRADGPQDRDPADRAGRACDRSSARSSATRRRHRARRACARPQLRHGRARPGLSRSASITARCRYRDPSEATFKGSAGPDGRVGTRNFIALCSTVNCSATVIRHIADRVTARECWTGLPAHRRRHRALARHRLRHGRRRRRLSRRWSACSGATPTHPNVTAAIFVGLGCEVMQIGRLKRNYGFERRTISTP